MRRERRLLLPCEGSRILCALNFYAYSLLTSLHPANPSRPAVVMICAIIIHNSPGTTLSVILGPPHQPVEGGDPRGRGHGEHYYNERY